MNIREKLGVFRSIAMYYWKPFNKRRLIRFYRPFIQSGDLCFDIGAHLGNRTNAWLALGAKVIAVEPQPSCIRYLKRKFGRNPKVTIVEKAIGAAAGKSKLYISELTPTVSTLADQDWRAIIDQDTSFDVFWQKEKEVDVITIDDLIQMYGVPAFTKLDIENYEFEALKGLSQALPCLSVEFYPTTIDRAVACVELLDQLGAYEYNWSFGESQKMNSTNWFSSQMMKDQLSKIKRGDASGDFYARLIQ
jgi:FkbM family methyltransferase